MDSMPTSTFRVGQHTLSVKDLHPRDAIRWAVGSPNGRRSSTWRLWGDKKGDVYVAMRSLANRLKVSIHRDRRCQVGFTSEFAKEAVERFGAPSRHWERWKLPDGPVIRALQIIIPDSDLEVFDADEKHPMHWIPAPGTGRAQVFSVFVAEPRDAYSWKSPEADGQLLGTMIGPTRSTWLVHVNQILEAESLQMIEHGRSQGYAMAAAQVPEDPTAGLRMTLWGHTEAKSDVFFVELDAKRFATRRQHE